jgi:tetratricopeptide (TPR) repeat protein
MFNGQFKKAIEYTDILEAQIPLDVLRPLAHFLESFFMVKPHVLVRFGRWEEIKALSLPEDAGLFPITIATIHYSKGVAYAATGDITNALAQQQLYLAALENLTPTHMVFPNKAIDVLAVGTAMLDGEIEYRKGNYDVAFQHLRTSISRYDSLGFGEPWSWMQPVRHAYAALKLEQGAVEEALDVYGADLGFNASLPRAHQHPNNVWALHGYHECLVKLGREAEAALVKPQLRLALAIAEVDIKSSCFCRIEVEDGLCSGKSCC